MTLPKKISLSFYFSLCMYLTSNFTVIQGFETGHEKLWSRVEFLPQNNMDVFSSLKILQRVCRDIQQEESLEHENLEVVDDHQIINKIIEILIGTYQKIITATVTYYLTANLSSYQYNLHHQIAAILVEDMLEIMKLVGQSVIKIVSESHISWKEKVYYCCGAIIMIIIIKYGIDQIPLSQNNLEKNGEIEKNMEKNENVGFYLQNNFGNWEQKIR